MQKTPRKVALLIQTSSAWSRQMLQGIASYAHEQGHWEFFIEPRGLYERLETPKDWRGDGILARVTDPLARSIRRLGVPAVNVSWAHGHSRAIPKVASDEVACGNVAAKHFLDSCFKNFGYVGPLVELYPDELCRQFTATVEKAGLECHVFQHETAPRSGKNGKLSQHRYRLKLSRWLERLPKPIGLLLFSDRRGPDVIAACQTAGLRIPEDVSVLSAEHDPVISALSPIPLSYLEMTPGRVGYEAAALLDRLMNGEPSPPSPMLIPPAGIVQRLSTSTFAVDDPELSSALRFIRDHAYEPIRVADILRAVPLSRRSLEQRFSRILGRSPAAEIRRVRIERVKRLLVESSLPIPAIAERSGFNHTEVMIRCFRRETGLSPGQFRRSH